MKRQSQSKNGGFTLIELLVVISIIALLAAILFPVFARARENARKTACISNLKQIGLAVLQYSQDYDEKVAGSPGAWLNPYEPYLKSTQVMKCPSAPKSVRTNDYNRSRVAMDWNYISATENELQPIPFMQLIDPTRTWFAFDGRGSSDWTDIHYSQGQMGGATAPNWKTSTHYTVASWHNDGFSAVYFDGHVKWSPRAKMYMKYDGSMIDKSAQSSTTYYAGINIIESTQAAKNKLDPSPWYTRP